MTRIVKSAKGLYEGWNAMPDDQPRTCEGCGENLVLKGPEPLWFSTFQRLSWHAGCRLVTS